MVTVTLTASAIKVRYPLRHADWDELGASHTFMVACVNTTA
jgi:hypothetical protein